MNARIEIIAIALLTLLLAGCGSAAKPPQLGRLYTRSAMYHGAKRNPVVVIPGILGSKLQNPQTGEIGWGAFTGNFANPQTPHGARTAALPMEMGRPLNELTDELQPAGALDRVRLSLVGVPVTVSAYAGILDTLGAGGYRDSALHADKIDYGKEHFTCFQFDYDWRRDNVESAQRLHQFLLEKRRYVQDELRKRGEPADDVKFDIVAHSMGGLIARYCLMYGNADLPANGSAPEVTWAGCDLIDRVIQVGTPNAGAPQALAELVNGAQIAPILPKYEPAVLGTMPAVYQLLPRPRHGMVVDSVDRSSPVDLYNVATWNELGWGLASPRQDRVLAQLLPDILDAQQRRDIAIDHLRKCLDRARRFHEAIDASAAPPTDVRVYLIAGDAVMTDSTLVVDRASGLVKFADSAPGDGTVLRSSALLDERTGGEWLPNVVTPIKFHHVTFLFTNHLGLTRDPAFTDNVLYLLLEAPR